MEPSEKSRIHPETGELLTWGIRPFLVSYKNLNEYVDMPGWWNERGDDAVFRREDLNIPDSARRFLKAEYESRQKSARVPIAAGAA